jgi:hypothetical protein
MPLTMIRSTAARVSAVMPTIAPQIMPANIVSDWFTDMANSMSESFANTRVEIVKQLAQTSLPTADQLQSQWYLLGLGGAYGLATKLIMLVLMLVSLVMILTPLSNHSLRVRRTAQSFLGVGIFGALFFPLYSLLHDGVMAICNGMVNLATGKQASTINDVVAAMLAVVMPSDVWFKVIVSFIGMVLAYCAFAVALLNFLLVGVTGMAYPIAVALRPVAEKFNSLFHGANSAVITTLTTPIVVTLGFLLPTFASKMIPGVGASGIAAGIFTIIGALVAFFGPVAVAVFAFKGSNRVFGQLDFASIGGSVDVDSMPPVTSRDMDNSIKESGFKAFTSSFIPGAATAGLGESDDLLGDLKKLAIEGGSAAAAATGHPWVAGALNAVDTTLSKEKRAHQAEDRRAMPPPTGKPVDTSGPPTGSSPPPNQSPVQEWPDKQ